jgi:valyl-tRNA synthetase
MENKIEPVKLVKALLIVGSKEELINSQKEIIKRLGRLEELEIVNNKQKPTNFAVQVINDMEVCLNLAGLIDVEAEKKKINEEIEQTKKYIISLEERLANQEFIARAPEKIILELKEKLELSRARLQKLTERVTII